MFSTYHYSSIIQMQNLYKKDHKQIAKIICAFWALLLRSQVNGLDEEKSIEIIK